MALHPGGIDAAVFSEGHLHLVATTHDFESTISCIHLIDGGQNGQMLDVLDVGISIGVDVRVETA